MSAGWGLTRTGVPWIDGRSASLNFEGVLRVSDGRTGVERHPDGLLGFVGLHFSYLPRLPLELSSVGCPDVPREEIWPGVTSCLFGPVSSDPPRFSTRQAPWRSAA